MTKLQKSPIVLDGNSLTLDRIKAIAEGAEIILPQSIRKRLESSRTVVKKKAESSEPTYGINTGFGYLANTPINQDQQAALQTNLLRSHAAGYGKPLSVPETRLAMALRLNSLAKGYTGVRYELCEALYNLIKAEIYPVIPEYGSVGASGDLAPLAHLALPLIGEGSVWYKGEVIPAQNALKKAKLKPLQLAEKEGLGLINGTQIMLSVGGLALMAANELLIKSDKITALTFEALMGHLDPLNPLLHQIRQQKGQIESASNILAELEGSYLFLPTTERMRIQDPYSMRCAPQVHGASRDAINYACLVIERELNAATDNPLIFAEYNKILSGGNFHGQPLALAYDIAALALSEISSISERRLELLLNPHLSGLPPFLTPKEGVHSGYMAMQYLSASFVNENKLLANPACTDSIPGNVGIEDHVSMGMTSARKLKKLVSNVRVVLCLELIAAAQAIDLRRASPLGKGTKNTYSKLRSVLSKLTNDRIVSNDINSALEIFDHI